VLAEVKRGRSYPESRRNNLRRQTKKPNSKIIEAEKHLVALAAQDQQALAFIRERLYAADFSQPEARLIAGLLFETEFGEGKEPGHFLLDNLPDENAKKFLSRVLVEAQSLTKEKNEGILNDCIGVLKNERVRGRIDELKLEIKEAEQAGEAAKAAELLSALKSEIS
jgi:hypothetical protein